MKIDTYNVIFLACFISYYSRFSEIKSIIFLLSVSTYQNELYLKSEPMCLGSPGSGTS